MRGVNDDEIGEFVKFSLEHGVTVRFIEIMPFDGNAWNPRTFVSYIEMKDILMKLHVSVDDMLYICCVRLCVFFCTLCML
jgi:cyclic pyranopterin phosphate synthase